MLLTVMIPSRERPLQLKATIASYYQNCKPGGVEFIVRLDDDDPTLNQSIQEARLIAKIIIGPRLHGYESIHTFCNEMLQLAKGDWIMLGNDDATMVTKGWDEVLGAEKPRCILLNPNDDSGNHAHIFPIVNRKICIELGHFALNCYTDRWLQNVYGPAGLVKDIPIRIKHSIGVDQCSEDRRTMKVFSDEDWERTGDMRRMISNFLKNHDQI